jgi:hypothetical protein
MRDAWGPFVRQCITTRVIQYATGRRSGQREVGENNTICTGFSAFRDADGSVEITASTSANGQSSAPIISRISRQPNGVSNTAAPGEAGLLAQGSDVPLAAEWLAREIGVPSRRIVAPNETLLLPIRLHVPSTIDGILSCHLDGQRLDRGRQTLVFSCVLDEHARTDRLDAQLHLAGVEEIDVPTGIRLTSVLSGWLKGRERFNDQAHWQPADDHIRYHRETELETPPAAVATVNAPS